MKDDALLAELAAWARSLASRPAQEVVLANASDVTVVRVGDVVAKAHAADAEPGELEARLRIASALEGVLLQPLSIEPRVLQGRLATVWPAGEPLDRDQPDAAPWEAAARLLARLHATCPLAPANGARGKLHRAMSRLAAERPSAARTAVERAFSTLPGSLREGPERRSDALVHGDFHLGQLVHVPDRGLVLIDVDDLGFGDPAWDLARPAAWFAVGVLEPEDWACFVDGYRGSGGKALERHADVWGVVEPFARAMTVQTAALAVVAAARDRRRLDEVEELFVDACDRME